MAGRDECFCGFTFLLFHLFTFMNISNKAFVFNSLARAAGGNSFNYFNY